MSVPTRPRLLPRTSHTSTRYEVDFLDHATQQWYLLHMRKDLEGAKRAKAAADARGYFTRLVVVSEERRLVGDSPSTCRVCETLGRDHPGNCDDNGSLGSIRP